MVTVVVLQAVVVLSKMEQEAERGAANHHSRPLRLPVLLAVAAAVVMAMGMVTEPERQRRSQHHRCQHYQQATKSHGER